ncbi:YbjN domain-containing protein [Palleronia caenipelagi]|uniref:Diacylglyceryl transferase n=1 Tax=Palleronia caenipelagi TaxID=2489174 RepID=A0A547PMY3_9RHOB|nr:YbjN domain-containing protein [Palleronia caenipelagi]TRD15508.1 diacylglyceryl transferase [Palleronia caenipelagi]
MSLNEPYFTSDYIDPIDIVEHLAEFNAWEFDRVAADQIAMRVDAQWRSYSVTLAWCGGDETLRLVCTFEMEPPEERMGELYELLNAMNDQSWLGAFSYWRDEKLMVYRSGLPLDGDQMAAPEQIDRMIEEALSNAERFYPAIQLVCWANRAPKDAMQVAIAETYGTA